MQSFLLVICSTSLMLTYFFGGAHPAKWPVSPRGLQGPVGQLFSVSGALPGTPVLWALLCLYFLPFIFLFPA